MPSGLCFAWEVVNAKVLEPFAGMTEAWLNPDVRRKSTNLHEVAA